MVDACSLPRGGVATLPPARGVSIVLVLSGTGTIEELADAETDGED